jgi:hypothetical protein
VEDIRKARMKATQEKNEREAKRLAGLELAARNTAIAVTCFGAQLGEK